MKLAFWITLKNLRSRFGALVITVLAVALASATALIVPLITRQVERGAQDAAQVFDLLIAARGSPTQALTSSLFYLDQPTGNLPAQLMTDLKQSAGTKRVVPIGLGDNYLGFPIVGTSTAFFEQRIKPKDPPYFQLAQGTLFKTQFKIQFTTQLQTVVGARVAREAALTLGATFKGSHGLEERADGEDKEHEGLYTVVGILKPTGGPVDRAILTPIETIWAAHHQNDPKTRQVTALLYSAEQLAGIYTTAQKINASKEAMAVFPGQVFAQAKDVLNQGQAAYAGLSILVLGIAALTVLLSVYTSSIERQKMVALLRALGTSRGTIFGLVVLETLVVVSLGVLLGLLLCLLISSLGGQLLGQKLGFTLAAPQLTWPLVSRVLLLIPVAFVAALPPAFIAMRSSPLKHIGS